MRSVGRWGTAGHFAWDTALRAVKVLTSCQILLEPFVGPTRYLQDYKWPNGVHFRNPSEGRGGAPRVAATLHGKLYSFFLRKKMRVQTDAS